MSTKLNYNWCTVEYTKCIVLIKSTCISIEFSHERKNNFQTFSYPISGNTINAKEKCVESVLYNLP